MVPDSFLAPILESMGETPDAVAKTLRSAGIHGVRNTVRFLNPIVRFVQLRLAVDAVSLDLFKADTLRLRFHDRTKEEIALPVAVKGFLAAFKEGAYPELEMLQPEQA